ncbi:cache domain-containing sensor histidine kinase [Paenibacillus arenilitoris]|uniref:Histidine kinase n=1 Tax=Paenibacillus arenilitoris TaxID=2772299 RepID=A0A927CFJ4_9BACL|nr:sensor histidine kinase [Paenibacillus arenilitoris]MBD2867148.1 histidine kinase [Paenibacillus arenilitoris]
MTKFVSISTKNLLLLGSLILVLVLGSGTVLYAEFHRIFHEQVTNDFEQIMHQNTSNLNQIIDSINQATLLLYADKTIVDVLAGAETDFIQNYNDKELVLGQLAKYIYIPLHNKLTSYQLTFFVSGKLPFSKTLPASDTHFNGLFSDAMVQAEPWFRQTLERDGVLCWYRDPVSRDHFFVSRLVKYPIQTLAGKLQHDRLGVILIKFDMNQLIQKIESSKMPKSPEFVVLDESGNVMYGKDPDVGETVSRHFKVRDRVTDSIVSESFMVGKRSYTLSAHRLANGWSLIAAIPNSEISARMAVVKTTIVNAALAALAIGIAMSLAISSKISRPIKRLAHIMRSVHNQEAVAQVSLPRAGNDEVGILYNSFSLMMSRMNRLLQDVYEMGVKEKEAELKALQAQINPHFLYNTLDSVNWMAMRGGARPIADVISSLSSLLRYSIKDADRLVLVAEEIEQVKQYICIQSICYEHVFDVIYELDPDVLACRMPRLILQPLVENAIQHGIEKLEGKGEIRITGFMRGETVQLAVSNSGAGADPEELNDYLKGRNLFQGKPEGNGIRNVDQRLRLVFGDRYGLRYEPNGDGGIRAVLAIPLNVPAASTDIPAKKYKA